MAEYAGLDIAGGEEGEVVNEDGLADQVPVVDVHTHLIIIISIYGDHHTQ